MPKMHYFSNKFSKIAKRWGSPHPAPLNLQFWWPEVTWCGQILFFQDDYDEIELQQISYDDVMAIMSPFIKNFPFCPPLPQSKFLATPVI